MCMCIVRRHDQVAIADDVNRLSVFFVALADWVVFGLSPSIATYVGGALIFVAFGLLTKETLGEKKH